MTSVCKHIPVAADPWPTGRHGNQCPLHDDGSPLRVARPWPVRHLQRKQTKRRRTPVHPHLQLTASPCLNLRILRQEKPPAAALILSYPVSDGPCNAQKRQKSCWDSRNPAAWRNFQLGALFHLTRCMSLVRTGDSSIFFRHTDGSYRLSRCAMAPSETGTGTSP
ncbi:hypothetical protein Baya_9676 [Bagarius yarrelli]|uniref:Uncharacterized protein n=1 Tax=Bagarius yarrelli TaxID=175774 RepID=A0A556UFH4_BAGYA|nr:hypothetical protein Baya_9676 [Bagarius yarrelli]